MYRQFLAAVRRDDPARPEAQKVLAEIEEALRGQPPPPEATPPVPPTPTAPTTPPAPVEPAPATTVASTPAPTTLQVTAPPHRKHRGLRIAGVVIGVVGIGLLGGGIGTAVAADGAARDLNHADRTGGVFDPSKDRAYGLDRALSIGFFSGGAVLAAAGVALLVGSAR